MLAESDDDEGFAKGCALIRSNLGVDINEIDTEEEWAALYGQAIWLEGWRNKNLIKNMENLLIHLFGSKKG